MFWAIKDITKMRVIGLQLDIAWQNPAANYLSVRRLLAQANPSAGGMIVLAEMFASGFTMNVAAAGDHRDETEGFLSELAKEFEVSVVAGVVSRASAGRGRNEAVVIGPDGKPIARYCKLHPFMAEADHYPCG